MYQRIYYNYIEKVIFIVSHWHYDSASIKRREENNMSEEKFGKILYEMIEKEFNYQRKPKVFYIDSEFIIKDKI